MHKGVCFLSLLSFTHTNNSSPYERHTKRANKREKKDTDTHIHILEVQSCHHTKRNQTNNKNMSTFLCQNRYNKYLQRETKNESKENIHI